MTLTYEQLREVIREAIASAWGGAPGTYTWVRDFNDTTIWYEHEVGGVCHTYQVSYTVADDGAVTIGQDRTEVQAVTTWVPATKIDIAGRFDVVRKNDADQYIFGWANVSVRKDGTLVVDSDGENVPLNDLEAAAYNFCLKYRATGEDHQGEQRGEMIESVIYTPEKQEAMGLTKNADGEWPLPQGWWVGFHIDDADDFAKIVKGEKLMFSIQGRSLREEVAA